jgi:hypothetical protein
LFIIQQDEESIILIFLHSKIAEIIGHWLNRSMRWINELPRCAGPQVLFEAANLKRGIRMNRHHGFKYWPSGGKSWFKNHEMLLTGGVSRHPTSAAVSRDGKISDG